MDQEEHTQEYSNNSSGGGGGGGGGEGGGCSRSPSSSSSSSKRMKQKKVPQRGLGVAQLERIRLEEQQKEQQKKDAAAAAAALQQSSSSPTTIASTPNPIISPTTNSTSSSSSCLPVRCPTFRSSVLVSSSTTTSSTTASVVPILPSSPTDHFPSLNSMFRPHPPPPAGPPSIPNVEMLMNPNTTVPLSKPLNNNLSSGGERGWSATVPVPGHGNWPRLWNGDYNLEGENQRMDHLGFRYHRPNNVNLGYESTPSSFVPIPPNLMQRSPQIQPPSPSSLVNFPTGISSSPGMNFQMEPPSNQNIHGSNNNNYYTPLWPDEEKMIGIKRPYPFSVETRPPAPDQFHFKFRPTYVAALTSSSRLDEQAAAAAAAASCNNNSNNNNRSCISTNTDRGFPVIRECPVRTNTMSSEPATTKLGYRDREQGGGLDGDFLTLAPPTTTSSSSSSPQLSSKHRQSSSLTNSGLHSCQLSDSHHHHPHQSQQQGSNDAAVQQGQGSSKPVQPPLLSLFPPSPNRHRQQQQQKIGHSSKTTVENNNSSSDGGGGGENIDLSLKL